MDCLFCKIVSGEIPSLKIYEDEISVAFLDINPDSNGHTLLIPKRHFQDLDDIDINTLTKLYEAAKKVKKLLEEKLGCEGMSLLQNNGIVEEVKHYHLHLKPFYKGVDTIEFVKHKESIKDPKEVYEMIKN